MQTACGLQSLVAALTSIMQAVSSLHHWMRYEDKNWVSIVPMLIDAFAASVQLGIHETLAMMADGHETQAERALSSAILQYCFQIN